MLRRFRFAWQSRTTRRDKPGSFMRQPILRVIDSMAEALVGVPGAWISYEVRPRQVRGGLKNAAKKHAKVTGVTSRPTLISCERARHVPACMLWSIPETKERF
jgi:hypothetical protein